MFESRYQDAESEDEGSSPSDAWKLQPKVCCGIERATGLQSMSQQCLLHPFAISVCLTALALQEQKEKGWHWKKRFEVECAAGRHFVGQPKGILYQKVCKCGNLSMAKQP